LSNIPGKPEITKLQKKKKNQNGNYTQNTEKANEKKNKKLQWQKKMK